MSSSKTLSAVIVGCIITMLVGTVSAEARMARSSSVARSSGAVKVTKPNHYQKLRGKNPTNMHLAAIILATTNKDPRIDKDCAKRVLRREVSRADKSDKIKSDFIMDNAEKKVIKECRTPR